MHDIFNPAFQSDNLGKEGMIFCNEAKKVENHCSDKSLLTKSILISPVGNEIPYSTKWTLYAEISLSVWVSQYSDLIESSSQLALELQATELQYLYLNKTPLLGKHFYSTIKLWLNTEANNK